MPENTHNIVTQEVSANKRGERLDSGAIPYCAGTFLLVEL